MAGCSEARAILSTTSIALPRSRQRSDADQGPGHPDLRAPRHSLRLGGATGLPGMTLIASPGSRRKSAAANAGCFLTAGHPLTGRRPVRFRRRRRNRPFARGPTRRRGSPTVGRGSHLRRRTSSVEPASSLHRRGPLPPLLGSPRRVEPDPASASGPRASGHGLPAQGGGHRARRRALATSDAGFALSDSPELVGGPIAGSSDRSSGLAACRPIT